MREELEAIRRRVAERRRIDAEDVETIRKTIYHPDSPAGAGVAQDEAEYILALNDLAEPDANDSGWIELFVEALKRHLLDDPGSPGRVDPGETKWLMERIGAEGGLGPAERSLLWDIRHAVEHEEIWGGIHSGDLEATANGLEAHLYCRACDGGKGGDFYYFSVSATDLLTRVVVADTCGHGEAVTQISQWLYDALAVRINSADGHEVLCDLNRLAAVRGFKAMTTATVLTFDRSEGHVDFAYAGHPPAYLCPRGGHWQPLTVTENGELANLPLGVVADAGYRPGRRKLAPGDRLFLYTDGVIEAPGTGGLYGIGRAVATLEARAGASARTLKDAVLAALWRHTGGDFTHDDVTLMVIEVRGEAA